jgi:hypothetical protein
VPATAPGRRTWSGPGGRPSEGTRPGSPDDRAREPRRPLRAPPAYPARRSASRVRRSYAARRRAAPTPPHDRPARPRTRPRRRRRRARARPRRRTGRRRGGPGRSDASVPRTGGPRSGPGVRAARCTRVCSPAPDPRATPRRTPPTPRRQRPTGRRRGAPRPPRPPSPGPRGTVAPTAWPPRTGRVVSRSPRCPMVRSLTLVHGSTLPRRRGSRGSVRQAVDGGADMGTTAGRDRMRRRMPHARGVCSGLHLGFRGDFARPRTSSDPGPGREAGTVSGRSRGSRPVGVRVDGDATGGSGLRRGARAVPPAGASRQPCARSGQDRAGPRGEHRPWPSSP